MSNPKQTYARPNTPLEDHLARVRDEGHTIILDENDSLVSVETITRWNSRDLNIFRKSDGKKITSFEDMRAFLHLLIREG